MKNSLKDKLEHLTLLKSFAKLDSSVLNTVISHFYKLKSLDITYLSYLDSNAYTQLVNSRMSLPNLVKLAVRFKFNEAQEEVEHSIKPQLCSLTLQNGNGYTMPLTNLNYNNLRNLKLIGIEIDATVLPPSLTSLSLHQCNSNFKDISKIPENLKKLKIVGGICVKFSEFLKELDNLVDLSISSSAIWKSCENDIPQFKPLKLESLLISTKSYGLFKLIIEHICDLDHLTSLEMPHCELNSDNFNQIFSKYQCNNLTKLNISDNNICGKAIPIIKSMKKLKYLSMNNSNRLKNEDREEIFSLKDRISYIECGFLSVSLALSQKETNPFSNNIQYFDSLLEDIKTDQSKSVQPNNDSIIPSFNVAKKLLVTINNIQGFSFKELGFRYSNSLSFSIECSISSKEMHSTRIIPVQDLNHIEWNQEIEFDSLISEISCDYSIKFSLVVHREIYENGLTNRNVFRKHFECPVFDSNWELLQGNQTLFLKDSGSNISLSIKFPSHDSIVKYFIDRQPNSMREHENHSNLEECLRNNRWSIDDASHFAPFLSETLFESQNLLYEANQIIEKWKQPNIMEMFTVFSLKIGLFAKKTLIKYLEDIPDEVLKSILPYLIQCSRNENETGVLIDYIVNKSKVLGNHLFWTIKSEISNYPISKLILLKLLRNFTNKEIEIIRDQCLFMDSFKQFNTCTMEKTTLMPYTLQELEPGFYKIGYNQNFELRLTNGNTLIVHYHDRKTCREVHHSLAFTNFMKLSKLSFLMDDKLQIIGESKIEYYPISNNSGFSIIPKSLEEKKATLIPEFIQSQSQSFRDNFLNSIAFDNIIRNLYDLKESKQFYFDQNGHVERLGFSYRFNGRDFTSLRLIVSKPPKQESLMDLNLSQYLKTNDLFQQFKIISSTIVLMLKNNQQAIYRYFEPFIGGPNSLRGKQSLSNKFI